MYSKSPLKDFYFDSSASGVLKFLSTESLTADGVLFTGGHTKL